jgi:hypothetical protein
LLHAPVFAVNVWPTVVAPVIVGGVVFAGATTVADVPTLTKNMVTRTTRPRVKCLYLAFTSSPLR